MQRENNGSLWRSVIILIYLDRFAIFTYLDQFAFSTHLNWFAILSYLD